MESAEWWMEKRKVCRKKKEEGKVRRKTSVTGMFKEPSSLSWSACCYLIPEMIFSLSAFLFLSFTHRKQRHACTQSLWLQVQPFPFLCGPVKCCFSSAHFLCTRNTVFWNLQFHFRFIDSGLTEQLSQFQICLVNKWIAFIIIATSPSAGTTKSK